MQILFYISHTDAMGEVLLLISLTVEESEVHRDYMIGTRLQLGWSWVFVASLQKNPLQLAFG